MNLQSESNNSKIQNPKSKIIKVLLVDDSPLTLTVLKRMLSLSPDIEVVGTAGNGKEALELIPKLEPSVICTDLHMPVMDGIEFTKEVMSRYPRPILVISVSVLEDSENAFRMLDAGAIDIFPKPGGVLDSELQNLALQLITKIKVLSGVHILRRFQKKPSTTIKKQPSLAEITPSPLRMVIVGASTGGPQALQTIFTSLPSNFRIPIVCVQHINDEFLSGFVDWLSSQCATKVAIAQMGMSPLPGTIYLPQEGTHLKFDTMGRFVSSLEPSRNGHRPSITVTMQSAAQYYGSAVTGVLLTGMGSDGVDGMLSIKQAGGITIAQDEESCAVFGMPKQAIEHGAARYVLPLNEIAGILIKLQDQRME